MELSVIRYRFHYPSGPDDGSRRIGDWKFMSPNDMSINYATVLNGADEIEFLYSAQDKYNIYDTK